MRKEEQNTNVVPPQEIIFQTTGKTKDFLGLIEHLEGKKWKYSVNPAGKNLTIYTPELIMNEFLREILSIMETGKRNLWGVYTYNDIKHSYEK